MPLTGIMLREMVQKFLNKMGRKPACLVQSNNLPGPHWLRNFRRRRHVTIRAADKVKGKRSVVSRDILKVTVILTF